MVAAWAGVTVRMLVVTPAAAIGAPMPARAALRFGAVATAAAVFAAMPASSAAVRHEDKTRRLGRRDVCGLGRGRGRKANAEGEHDGHDLFHAFPPDCGHWDWVEIAPRVVLEGKAAAAHAFPPLPSAP